MEGSATLRVLMHQKAWRWLHFMPSSGLVLLNLPAAHGYKSVHSSVT